MMGDDALAVNDAVKETNFFRSYSGSVAQLCKVSLVYLYIKPSQRRRQKNDNFFEMKFLTNKG